jgi:hypothetical protein
MSYGLSAICGLMDEARLGRRKIDVVARFDDVTKLQDHFNEPAMSYIRNVVPCVQADLDTRDDKREPGGSTAAADRELAVDGAILFADALEFVRTLRRQVPRLGLTMADRGGPRHAQRP